ncbi:MAG: DUF1638 domain-containing protein [Armatimonadota bacterium]|nr:DUF1638 domain-containing protein [bacterium]
MKIKVIACEALTREIRLASARSPHVIDIEYLAFGLHNTPDDLRKTIQEKIDASEGQGYDCIVLGYGLCSRGTANIQARSIPIVIPRAHDCITFFLGSRARYDEEFSTHPGTYYYSPGWIERKEGDVQQGLIEDVQARAYEDKYREYVEKYGEDNAKFLIEQEQQWYQHYTRAAFINMDLGDVAAYRKFTQDLANDRGWEYSEIQGDVSLLQRLANGDWADDAFLKIEPGQKITESFDPKVLKAE